MLTKEHKRMLAVLVGQQRHVLMAKTGPNVTQRMKAEIWSQIVQQLRSTGASIEETRNVREVEWNNIKRRATKRQELGRPLDDLDLLVLEALGKNDNNDSDNNGPKANADNRSNGDNSNLHDDGVSNGLLVGHHAIFSSPSSNSSCLEPMPLSVEISENNSNLSSMNSNRAVRLAPLSRLRKRGRESEHRLLDNDLNHDDNAEDEGESSVRSLKRSLLSLELEMGKERRAMERERHALEMERMRIDLEAHKELLQLQKEHWKLKNEAMRSHIGISK